MSHQNRQNRQEVADERGAATLVGAGAVLVVLAVFAIVVQLGAAVITRHRAEAAADLAALAAAAQLSGGAEHACGLARRVTDRMAVRLTSCESDEWDVVVSVEATPSGPVGRFGAARAQARAGPAPLGPAENDHSRRTVVRQR